ncbi:MAG TPA: hypothetical protein VN326_03175 [Casimicrobiaceae bacterium]|nr:hypothetical protein [Casimicrobiaceae bacterium]
MNRAVATTQGKYLFTVETVASGVVLSSSGGVGLGGMRTKV